MRRVGRPGRQEALLAKQRAAIDRLVGQPLAVEPAVEETRAERIAVLMERVAALTAAEVNPYQRDFSLFATTLCWTRDEARGGREALMPDYPYLRELDERLLTCHPLLVEKSRRTIVSWRFCCFDLWIAAGGQDPRWPALMNSTKNRGVIVASQKMDGVAGSKEMLLRVRYIYDQFEARGLRQHWPDFPEFTWSKTKATASNGSWLWAVPQGPNQLRGPGVTWIHGDEFSYWPEAQGSVASALQTLQGGGHFAGIATACAGTYAGEIVAEKVKKGQGYHAAAG